MHHLKPSLNDTEVAFIYLHLSITSTTKHDTCKTAGATELCHTLPNHGKTFDLSKYNSMLYHILKFISFMWHSGLSVGLWP